MCSVFYFLYLPCLLSQHWRDTISSQATHINSEQSSTFRYKLTYHQSCRNTNVPHDLLAFPSSHHRATHLLEKFHPPSIPPNLLSFACDNSKQNEFTLVAFRKTQFFDSKRGWTLPIPRQSTSLCPSPLMTVEIDMPHIPRLLMLFKNCIGPNSSASSNQSSRIYIEP